MASAKSKKVAAASKNKSNGKKANTGQKRARGGTRKNIPEAPGEIGSEVLVAIDPTEVPAGTGTGDTAQARLELEEEVAEIRAALEKERMQNAELQRQIDAVVNNPSSGGQGTTTDPKPIPRPSGTAGTDFSIQEGMGLTGTKKYETYKAIQRNLRDLAMNARINWEVPWSQVPAREKARLFEVARDQHPFLARFERDWATEEIVKQFLKNKRKNHYANGWLEVPEKYAYLKENSRKRNPTAPRTKRSLARAD